MSNLGNLEAIWLKPRRRQPMRAVSSATLVANRGILGNADQNGRRQVTIIGRERWQIAEEELGQPVDPVLRRANLLISGVELVDTRGRALRVGACLIEIWGETRPCRLLDDQLPGLQDVLRGAWGGGVFGIIVEGGEISVGDRVELLESAQPSLFRDWKMRA